MKLSEIVRQIAVCPMEGCEAGHPLRAAIVQCPACGRGTLISFENLVAEQGLDSKAVRRLDAVLDENPFGSDKFFLTLVDYQWEFRLSAVRLLYPLIDLIIEGRRLFGEEASKE